MLRKIVNMLMGSAESAGREEQTYFERLLDESKPQLRARLSSNGADPVEALAETIMEKVVESGTPANPQAGRAYFSVLVENDRLPAGAQLDESELGLLRDLLVEYFSGNETVRDRANEVLALIERKFSEGAFTQARILLQIFETDVETKLNNERNLFYEDMIMRLGIRRRHEVPTEERDGFRETAAALEPTDDEVIKELLSRLAHEYYVHFCLDIRSAEATKEWARFGEVVDESMRDRLLKYVPPLRWRSPFLVAGESVIEMATNHLQPEATERYVQRLIKMCYFLLLASGDTGFESYIYSLLAWSRDEVNVDVKRLLPFIHRRSVLDEIGLQETLDEVYQDFYAATLAKRLDGSREKIEGAWRGFLKELSTMDLNDIPPGHYDLGGFLLDQLLGFKQPDPYFSFKLYRLT